MIGKRLALIGLLALASMGCGDGVSCYPVQGSVTFNGKPFADATIDFVPDPENSAITAGAAVTDAEGNYKVVNLGKAGLSPGQYKVVVTPKVADGSAYEDAEQRRMALESLGVDPLKQANKEGKVGGEFKGEVRAEPNVLDFDVKGKTVKP